MAEVNMIVDVADKTRIEINSHISPSLHETSLSPFAEAMTQPADGHTTGTPHTVAAFNAASMALRTLYAGLGDLENASTVSKRQYGNHGVLPEDKAVELSSHMGAKFASVARTFDSAMSTVVVTEQRLSAVNLGIR